MAKKMRMTQVHDIQDISPHMRRIILSGEDLQDFPIDQESAHVKVIIPRPGEQKPKLGLYPGAKKWMRSYTVRYFDTQLKRLTLDFAVNDHTGLATDWAQQAQVGDYLGIAGPGPTKHTDYHADWHLIVGDLTALPALAATIEKLPPNAKGFVYAQVPNADDIQDLKAPENVRVQWIINQDKSQNMLLEDVKRLEWLEGSPAIFIAKESNHMKQIKAFVKTKPGYNKEKVYASGYWKA